MNENPNIPEIDNETNQSALSILGDPNEEFPVLKAFQQYIDAEQSKARKRMLALCIFFGCLLTVVVVIFLYLLNSANERNQLLNDRMFAYATNNANNVIRESSAQDQVDSSAILKLTARIEELQNKLTEAQQRAIDAEKARAAAVNQATVAAESAKAKEPSPEELEIARLKSLLAAERDKAEAERKRRHEEELEAYRRKHYPELYGLPKTLPKQHRLVRPATSAARAPARVSEIDDEDLLPDDDTAINYFDDAEDAPAPAAKAKTTKAVAPKAKVVAPAATPSAQPAPEKPAEPPYEIPVEVKGKNSSFRIPI